MAKKSETMSFNAEVGKVLQLMIHSLYTNKDIFLRELISNASDACDKLRYLGVTKAELLADHPGFKIAVQLDKEARTITIADTGIGMNRQDLIDHLGTIASSGTQRFIEQATGDAAKDTQLIGQFGVGFYSVFMIADQVEVITRKAGDTEAWQWTSDGKGEFKIEAVKDTQPVGTQVRLHIREGEDDYLDKFRIRHIVKTYSDHIAFPVELMEDGGEPSVLNSSSALWMRPKAEISDEQYQEFYKSVAHAGDTPWMTLHNKNEGTLEYTNLLFFPSKKPFDLFHPDRRARVKLYVKRVYITDEGVELIPAYLRFIRGIVDSQDLPLNISRETLQHNLVIEKIRKSIVSRVLSELGKKAKQDAEGYAAFWHEFGAVFKEGLCEGGDNREALLEASRFYSTTVAGLVSLDEYVARMKPDQDCIYYMTGDDLAKLRSNPLLEGFQSRGIEVLLLTDPVDDFWVNVVHEYKEKPMKSVTRTDIDLANEADKDAKPEDKPKAEADDASVLEFMKATLAGLVHDVKATTKLVDTPACLGVSEGAMDMRMERYLLDQRQLATRALKTLEVNLQHPLNQHLAKQLHAGNLKHEQAEALVRLIFDQACILAGEPLTDAKQFCQRMNQFVQGVLAA